MPIYEKFFILDKDNSDAITLKSNHSILSIENKKNDNIYEIKDNSNQSREIFIKYSPLVDPIKYMIGKYKTPRNNTEITRIPF